MRYRHGDKRRRLYFVPTKGLYCFMGTFLSTDASQLLGIEDRWHRTRCFLVQHWRKEEFVVIDFMETSTIKSLRFIHSILQTRRFRRRVVPYDTVLKQTTLKGRLITRLSQTQTSTRNGGAKFGCRMNTKMHCSDVKTLDGFWSVALSVSFMRLSLFSRTR